MTEHIRISAVIPTYNRGHIVGRAIESALAQEYAPSEVIIVDDGSNDRTLQVVETYGHRVRYVHQANAGVSASRNRGIREAEFEWIAFLDSDDYWLPGHLKRMAAAIEATRGEAALYFSDTQLPHEASVDRQWRLCGLEINGEFEFRRDAGEWALMRVQPMMLQASLIRRQAYLELGGLPEQLRTREDTLLFFKLALLYPACAVSGCGTIMNSDDRIRLTQVYDGQTLVYCQATVFLFNELLASVNHIARDRRQLLMDCLGASYFGMGRVFVRRKQYVSAVRNLFRSCVISPSLFARELAHSLVRHLFKEERGAHEGNS